MKNLLNDIEVRPIYKPKLTRKVKVGIFFLGIFVLFLFAYRAFVKVNAWFNGHYFQFNQVMEVQFNQPIEIKERKVNVSQIVQVLNEVQPLENLTPIEEYICKKWGVYDCKTALAVARAESGMRENAININKNDTIDVGIFQINSVHFEQEGCSLKEVSDAYKNVDCAYGLWQVSNWSPWVAFLNGSFKNHIN